MEVRRGEIFGIVGPNGAGKTTTVECITGLRRPDSGDLPVLGLDPRRQERELRQRIGIQLQQAALPERIKVWEALDLFAAFYRHPVDWRPLLERVALAIAPFAAGCPLVRTSLMIRTYTASSTCALKKRRA